MSNSTSNMGMVITVIVLDRFLINYNKAPVMFEPGTS